MPYVYLVNVKYDALYELNHANSPVGGVSILNFKQHIRVAKYTLCDI